MTTVYNTGKIESLSIKTDLQKNMLKRSKIIDHEILQIYYVI